MAQGLGIPVATPSGPGASPSAIPGAPPSAVTASGTGATSVNPGVPPSAVTPSGPGATPSAIQGVPPSGVTASGPGATPSAIPGASSHSRAPSGPGATSLRVPGASSSAVTPSGPGATPSLIPGTSLSAVTAFGPGATPSANPGVPSSGVTPSGLGATTSANPGIPPSAVTPSGSGATPLAIQRAPLPVPPPPGPGAIPPAGPAPLSRVEKLKMAFSATYCANLIGFAAFVAVVCGILHSIIKPTVVEVYTTKCCTIVECDDDSRKSVNAALEESSDTIATYIYEDCSDLQRESTFNLALLVTGVLVSVHLFVKLRSRPAPGKAIFQHAGEVVDGWFHSERGIHGVTWFLPSPGEYTSLLAFKVPARSYSLELCRYLGLEIFPRITEVPVEAFMRGVERDEGTSEIVQVSPLVCHAPVASADARRRHVERVVAHEVRRMRQPR